jgi:hypothetical protein
MRTTRFCHPVETMRQSPRLAVSRPSHHGAGGASCETTISEPHHARKPSILIASNRRKASLDQQISCSSRFERAAWPRFASAGTPEHFRLNIGTCFLRGGFLPTAMRRKPMTKMRALSAVIILSAAVAAPVFAQDAGVLGPGDRYGLEPQPGPYHSTSCFQGPGFAQPCRGRLYGWSIGRDRSRVGGMAPSLRPSGS